MGNDKVSGLSIDGCHIPIMPPALNHTDYFNRKGWYSIILQAIDTIINIMGTIVREQICASVQKAGYFTILVDETKDLSKNEQMPLVFVTLILALL